jgi:hypothetical protein
MEKYNETDLALAALQESLKVLCGTIRCASSSSWDMAFLLSLVPIGALLFTAIAGYLAWRSLNSSRVTHLFSRLAEHNKLIADRPDWQAALAAFGNLTVADVPHLANSGVYAGFKNEDIKNAMKDSLNLFSKSEKIISHTLYLLNSRKASPVGKEDLKEFNALAPESKIFSSDFNAKRMAARLLHLSHLNLIYQAWRLSPFRDFSWQCPLGKDYKNWRFLAIAVMRHVELTRKPKNTINQAIVNDKIEKIKLAHKTFKSANMDTALLALRQALATAVSELSLEGQSFDVVDDAKLSEIAQTNTLPLWYLLGCRDLAKILMPGKDVYDDKFIAWINSLLYKSKGLQCI